MSDDEIEEPLKDLPAPYVHLDDIDFSRMHANFRELVFFDDTFLAMQAMNIVIVDQTITGLEYNLLKELFERERTPTELALEVSALSQMWIFAVYELLRTWGQRVGDFRKQLANSQLELMVRNLKQTAETQQSTAAIIRMAQAQSVLDDPTILDLAAKQTEALENVDRLLELLRINLAKHEAPGRRTSIAPMPGHGRINPHCGAMDFELMTEDGGSAVASRRDLADALREIQLPTTSRTGRVRG